MKLKPLIVETQQLTFFCFSLFDTEKKKTIFPFDQIHSNTAAATHIMRRL